jgi:outer membrane protein TolC
MRKTLACFVFLSSALSAAVHPMTLKQAVQAAMQQSPDVALARLDEEKARLGIRVARGPFTPSIGVGSGLAYSNGMPMSVEGSAPTVFQARASQFIFNRPQTFAVAQAREEARGAAIAVTGKREEVAWRVASLFLDAERAARIGALAQKDADSQEKVLATVQAQVREGRALPLAEKTAAYQLAYARQIALNLETDQATAESALALALGFPAEDRVRPVEAERPAPDLPMSEDQALRRAVESNKELRRLESAIAAKQLEAKGEKASRWPRVDLIAQYGLLARFNNYDDYFNRFQRNNAQIGMSFQLPVLTGSGAGAQVAQSLNEASRLRLELASTRNRLASDVQQSFRDARRAAGAADLARLDLEVAREQLSVDLAQMQEGRLGLREVEQARVAENQKWIAFYDAQYTAEKAKWNVLRLTGGLVPAVEALP